MPGVIFTPIANFQKQKATAIPYVPQYNAIYAASFDLYKVSGSTTGGTSGGIVKMDWEGLPDISWMANANVDLVAGQNFKEVRYAGGARDRIMADTRFVSGSTTYRQIRLIDKATGTVTASHGVHSDNSGVINGIQTDTMEEYHYVFGTENMKFDDETDTFVGGLLRTEFNTIDVDLPFTSSIGNGPIDTLGGTQKIIHDVHVNKNGKIGVCHNGTGWNQTSGKYASFVVLNNDGTVDTNFDFGSAQFQDSNGSTYNNGGVFTSQWFESGSNGYWLIGGNFAKFNNDNSYQRFMLFDESGNPKQSFSDNFRLGAPGGANLNGEVTDIEVLDAGASNGYMGLFGNFTSPFQNMVAVDNLGFAQIGGNQSNAPIEYGLAASPSGSQTFIINHENSDWTDNNGNTLNTNGIATLGIFNFASSSYFNKAGDGFQTIGNATPTPGSFFLG